MSKYKYMGHVDCIRSHCDVANFDSKTGIAIPEEEQAEAKADIINNGLAQEKEGKLYLTRKGKNLWLCKITI